MHKSANYSKELQNMIELDGIPYNLITQQEYIDVLQQAEFKNIKLTDTTYETIELCNQDCKKIIEKKDKIEKQFGTKTYQETLESWSIQKNVFISGELQTGMFTAQK